MSKNQSTSRQIAIQKNNGNIEYILQNTKIDALLDFQNTRL